MFFTTYFLRFAGVFFVTFYLAMKNATATLESPVIVNIFSSGGSSTAGSKWSCQAKSSTLRSVRFQSVKINGITYERTRTDYASLTSGGPVVQKTFTAADLGTCLLAAGKAGVDAIGYNNSVCSGYIMKTNLTTCPCLSEGDTLMFVNKKKISNSRSVIYSNVEFYTKTVVYSDVLAEAAAVYLPYDTIDNCLAKLGENSNEGQCYVTSGLVTSGLIVFNTTFCTSCTGAPVTVFTVPQTFNTTIFPDICGATVRIGTDPLYLLSHAAYGCTYYSQPSTATDCEVTFVKTGAFLFAIIGSVHLSRSGYTCNDELVVYNGTSTSGVEADRTCDGTLFILTFGFNVKMSVVFKRKPHVTGTSSSLGFFMKVL